MRHLITFILRLWVTPESASPTCEGEVECVATGEQIHIRSQEEAARFVLARLNLPPSGAVSPERSAGPFDKE
jgi:hypothetical protein